MKRGFIIAIALLSGIGTIAQPTYKPAIAYYSVSVDGDIRNAFRPLPDNANKSEGEAAKEVEQFLKDEATALKTGYHKYDAFLTDTCFVLLRESLKTKGIKLGEKVPKEGMFSYTPYEYPQFNSMKKAAKSGVAQHYIKMQVTITYKESFMESAKESSDKSRMTPRVKVNLDLADATGKSVLEGKSVVTADQSIQLQSANLYAGNKRIEGSEFRADDSIRRTLLLELFNKALSEAISKMK